MQDEAQHNDVRLMKALLTKLHMVLMGIESPADLSKERPTFISWCRPGIPFRPEDFEYASRGLTAVNAEDTRARHAAAAQFANLANGIPDTSGTFSPDGTKLWDVYRRVLTQSKVAAPDPLSSEDEAKLQRYNKALFKVYEEEDEDTGKKVTRVKPSDVVRTYEKYRDQYRRARSKYVDKLLSAQLEKDPVEVAKFARLGSDYQEDVSYARSQWAAEGEKNRVEKIRAFLEQVSQRDLVLYKNLLRNRFEQSQVTDLTTEASFWLTFPIPNDFADLEWTRFSFTSAAVDKYEKLEHNEWDMGASGRKGLFSFSASSSGHQTETEQHLNTDNFSMSFELVQVPILRPWFGAEFLASRFWKLDPEDTLCDGARPPKGVLPAFTTSAVFVRKLETSFDELRESTSTFSREINVGANVGFGPFSFGGTYTRGDESASFKSDLSNGTLTARGMQLVGFVCTRVGACPNPKSSIDRWS